MYLRAAGLPHTGMISSTAASAPSGRASREEFIAHLYDNEPLGLPSVGRVRAVREYSDVLVRVEHTQRTCG